MQNFEAFDELQKKVNEKYYRGRGRKIYSDFKTFGSSDKITYANAMEFFEWIRTNDDGREIKVYDFGIGNGLFSKFCLDKFYELDVHREFTPRFHYILCDISEELLQKAVKEMKNYSVETKVCNATRELPFLREASHIRSNEMYDDLPAKIFVRTENEICEVLMDERMKRNYVRAKRIDVKTERLMERMPVGYEITMNFAARKHLKECLKHLRKNAYIDIFDYGFSSIEEIKRYPSDVWNSAIVREFNSQLTIDVNFIGLEEEFNGTCQPQKEYAESILKEKLHYVELKQLYYFNDGEVLDNAKEMKKFGYPSDFIDSGITEIDDYKHLRIIKK